MIILRNIPLSVRIFKILCIIYIYVYITTGLLKSLLPTRKLYSNFNRYYLIGFNFEICRIIFICGVKIKKPLFQSTDGINSFFTLIFKVYSVCTIVKSIVTTHKYN